MFVTKYSKAEKESFGMQNKSKTENSRPGLMSLYFSNNDRECNIDHTSNILDQKSFIFTYEMSPNTSERPKNLIVPELERVSSNL